MRKLIVLLLAFAAVIGVPTALAEKPIFALAPAEDLVDSTTCGFDVAVHYTVSGETAKTFANGKVIVTGPLFAAFSANGKTISLNISGPATVVPGTDGSVAIIGRGVGAGPFLTPSGVTLAYAAGTVSLTDFASGTGPIVLEHGKILLDICAALAA
jgi:hypothetical protein